MSERESLDEFYIGNTVKPVKNVDDVNFNTDHFVYAGSNWCGHSRLGTAHFAEACRLESEDGKQRDCYGIDLAKEGGQDLAVQMGIPMPKGVPALFRYDAKNKQYEKVVSGRRESHQYAKIFQEFEGDGL